MDEMASQRPVVDPHAHAHSTDPSSIKSIHGLMEAWEDFIL